jgi:hypothetical protein
LFLKSHKIKAFIVYSMRKTRYMWQLIHPFFHRKDTVKEYLKQAWREMKHQGRGGEGVDEGNEAWSERTLKLRPFLQFTCCLESDDIPPHPHFPKTTRPFILKLHHRFFSLQRRKNKLRN